MGLDFRKTAMELDYHKTEMELDFHTTGMELDFHMTGMELEGFHKSRMGLKGCRMKFVALSMLALERCSRWMVLMA